MAHSELTTAPGASPGQAHLETPDRTSADSMAEAPKSVIALWSAPRSRSTAFLRMIMERGDLMALHEPFSQLADFGSCTVADQEVTSEPELIAAINRLGAKERVFFKDTTDFHYTGVLSDTDFLRQAEHTFIIRHPREVIPSHYALNPAVTLAEIGFARLHELFLAVAAATGKDPIVVDSDLLLDDPEATVREYNERVRLDHRPDALNWSEGTREEWSRTARWHTGASNSKGFARSERTYEATVTNHPVLAEFYEHEIAFYEYLLERRLKI
jgi:hypothetical protein